MNNADKAGLTRRIYQVLGCSAAVLLAACGGQVPESASDPVQAALPGPGEASRYDRSAGNVDQDASQASGVSDTSAGAVVDTSVDMTAGTVFATSVATPVNTPVDTSAATLVDTSAGSSAGTSVHLSAAASVTASVDESYRAATGDQAGTLDRPDNEASGVSSADGAPHQLASTTIVPTTRSHLYVSPSGSDANPGTRELPLKTIARADYRAGPGAIIHVAPGTYYVNAPTLGAAGITTTRSGTATARISFISDVRGAARIIVSGPGIAWHAKGNYVDIRGFDISGTGRHGILAYGANMTITRNFVHDLTVSGGCNGSGGSGIDTYGPGGNTLITGNIVRNIGFRMIGLCNTVQGIYIANANSVVKNNLVSGIAAVGIQQWHGATASTIVNNTTFHNKIGILLGQGNGGTTSGSANNYVANNIVYDNKTYGIIEGGKMGGNNRYVNNLVYASGKNWRVAGFVSGAVNSDPMFMSYMASGRGNYRVQKNSRAIDKGAQFPGPAVDIADVPRPRGLSFDIGAYEH